MLARALHELFGRVHAGQQGLWGVLLSVSVVAGFRMSGFHVQGWGLPGCFQAESPLATSVS